mgnify:CR=1 FL=1
MEQILVSKEKNNVIVTKKEFNNEKEMQEIIVHLSGAVKNAGVYKLREKGWDLPADIFSVPQAKAEITAAKVKSIGKLCEVMKIQNEEDRKTELEDKRQRSQMCQN